MLFCVASALAVAGSFSGAAAARSAPIHSWFDPLQRWGLPTPKSSSSSSPKAALVYVPGLDGSNGSPFAQYPRLAEQFELHVQQVSASPSASDASFDEIVEDVADALRRIARDSNGAGTVLMGESMGGVVVAGVAIRHPELVSGLILINPATSLSVMPDLQEDMRWILDSSIPEPLFPLALFAKIGWKTFDADLIAGALKDIFIEKKMEALRTDDPELAAYYDVALEALVAQLTEAKPSSFWRGRLRQLRAGCEYVEPQLPSLRPPTLVVAGTADALLLSDREAERLAQRIPVCDVHLVQNAGHAGTLNQRIDLPDVIGRWARKRDVPVDLPAELSPFGVAMGRPMSQRA